ncbi:MAG: dipeptidase [Ignavibacteria bacterium]|jgi:acetylornithine deacetylase/succinyl-diaminopimelate desuccinylase-like protein
MDNLIKYINDNENRFVQELIEFLKIPSISNNIENKNDIENCAKWLKNHIKSIGFDKVDIYNTPGNPIVYAEYLKAGKDKPTVLIYGHYDVQPVDPVDLWTDPPFEPTIKDGKIYARGTTDDKGQLFIHLKSLETYFKNTNSLPVNVKILLEGEEEVGSTNLVKFIRDNKELLKCNLIVISDTSMYAKGLPSICYGLRGLAYLQIDVTGPIRDLHSGSYGGAVDNPINALARIISNLKDDKGMILVDKFYDDVIPLSSKEREEFKRLPFDEEEFKKELEINAVFGEEGYTTTERLSARPTLDCNGIWGGFQGEGAKTVLPSKAGAKVSMRLVPNQDPNKMAKLFIEYVNKIAPKTVKVEVTDLHGGKPSITPIDTPAIKAALTALKKGYGVDPVFMREGGSIPIVNSFKEILGADTVLLGFGLPDENAHSPNEHFDLDNFHKGILSVTHYFEELSKI